MSQSLQYAIAERSIAVLPFTNRSPKPENDYFCDGATEEIIQALGKIRGLKVIATQSSFAFKDHKTSFQEIGKQLGVAAILTGSIRFFQKKVRIAVQMINVADGFQVWAESFDCLLDDMLAAQDEISLKIAERLREHLGHFDIDDQLLETSKVPIASYKLYLKARFLIKQLNRPDVEKAISLLQQVIKKAPHFPLPYLEMHAAYVFLGSLGVMPVEEAFQQGKQYLDQALTLDADLPESQFQLAQVYLWQKWKLEEACRLLANAIQGRPSYADAHQLMGLALVMQGNFKAAKSYQEVALRLNPFDANSHYQMGALYYFQQKYEEALYYFEKCIALDPDFLFAHVQMAAIYLLQNQTDKALQKVENLPSSSEADLSRAFISTLAYTQLGDGAKVKEGMHRLEQATQTEAKERALVLLIYTYAAQNQYDKALDRMEQATHLRSSMLLLLSREPLLQNLQVKPKFQALIKLVLGDSPSDHTPKQKYKKNLLSDEEIERHSQRVEQLMTQEKPYHDPSLTLRELAAKLDLHPNALSQLLNRGFHQNFAEYVNGYRLKSFTAKVKDTAFHHMTILALAFESGFNSKTAFNTFFKKNMGKTPSQYWKEHVNPAAKK